MSSPGHLQCMKMIRMFKKTFTFAIRTFCVVMFAWQFYLLTKKYQEFNVRKEVTNYIPHQIELPEIHILIPYQFAFDIKFLKSKYKASFESSCQYFVRKKECDSYITAATLFSKVFGSSLLLSDIAKHSYSPEKFLSRVYWSESEEDPLKTGKCSCKRLASAANLVLVISCLDPSGLPLKVSRARATVYGSNYLLSFALNATAMLVKLFYPGQGLVEDNSHYAYASTTQGKQVSLGIRFTKHTENLLPPPYKTMCKEYNRRQTFEDCLNVHSLARTGLLYPETSVPLEKYSQSNLMRFASFLNNGSGNGSLLKIFEICELLVVQPMCNSVRYSFKMASSAQDVPIGEELLRFYFIVTSEFDTLTKSKPDFDLSDYLILSGSLFSSWFGISIMGQLLAANSLCFLALGRKSTVETSQNDKDETRSETSSASVD